MRTTRTPRTPRTTRTTRTMYNVETNGPRPSKQSNNKTKKIQSFFLFFNTAFFILFPRATGAGVVAFHTCRFARRVPRRARTALFVFFPRTTRTACVGRNNSKGIPDHSLSHVGYPNRCLVHGYHLVHALFCAFLTLSACVTKLVRLVICEKSLRQPWGVNSLLLLLKIQS